MEVLLMRTGTRIALAAVAAGVLLAASAGCNDDNGGGGAADNPKTVMVGAPVEQPAASLVEAYLADNPGAELDLVVEDVSTATRSLTDQTYPLSIVPADWVTSTDMEQRPFGRQVLVLAVPEGNPGGVEDLSALSASSGSAAVCIDDPLIGVLVTSTITNAGVTDPPAVEAGCVDDALADVAAGTLDAVLTYRGELEVPDGVELVVVPDEENLVFEISYLVADEADEVQDFLAYLESDAADQALTELGYRP
jgi:molybdate transport system substrate-binding protein